MVDFKNALSYVNEGRRTISGASIVMQLGNYYEMYADCFAFTLNTNGFTSNADFEALLLSVDKFKFVFDVPKDHQKIREINMAAYGLVTLDRINEKFIKRDSFVFELFVDLQECFFFTQEVIYFFEAGLARKKSNSDRAKKGHAGNYAMKADVFAWLDSQPAFRGIEDAATAITKQQPITHVTGRDWFKEWKRLRFACKP